jgi:3-dehydro-L-gulonate-6-phosphate decarboxylase
MVQPFYRERGSMTKNRLDLLRSNRSVPLFQVALDYISLPSALAMALTVAPEVDIIELGTPLCKAAGLEAIRATREILPDKIILADLKTPDVGGLEAKMAFDAGADMMTVIGGAALATVEQALEVARQEDKEMLMELTGVRDIIARAKEWRQIGVERMVYHRGWDEQAAARQWTEDDKVIVRQLIDMGFKITVTGGITTDLLPFFQDLSVSIIISGRNIHKADDPRAAAREFRASLQRLWGEPRNPASANNNGRTADTAATAVRWGMSEMGLLLTVDGRDCPGCASPQRLCQGTQTSFHCPPGVKADDIIRNISQAFGYSSAFGRVAYDVFYLDPAQLPGVTPSRVLDLLTATGNALRQLGCQVDINAGVGVANSILNS